MCRPYALAAALLLAAPTAWPAEVAARQSYLIDGRHTRPVFAVDHLGFSTQYGRFNEVRGSVEIGADGLASIDVTIEAASIDMGAEEWDKTMRGKDFFDVESYPTLIFRAEAAHLEEGKETEIAGRLALLGQVRPVTLRIARFRCGLDVAAKRRKCGADATATIKRSEWGMKKYLPFVGDEIRLSIPVEAYPAADAR